MSIIASLLFNYASDVARRLYVILIEPSEHWESSDGYYLTNANRGIEFWIANGAYGLKVSINPPGEPPTHHVPLTWVDRQILWSQIRSRRIESPDSFKRRAAMRALKAMHS